MGLTSLSDVYDDEFNRYLQMAKGMIVQVRTKKDKEICTKWIAKLCALKSEDPIVKKNRNHFFKYLLTILHRGIDEKPEEHYGYPQYADDKGGAGEQGYTSRWSSDKRTYVAAKPMPGKGALVYMAVAKDPSLGWDQPNKKQ